MQLIMSQTCFFKSIIMWQTWIQKLPQSLQTQQTEKGRRKNNHILFQYFYSTKDPAHILLVFFLLQSSCDLMTSNKYIIQMYGTFGQNKIIVCLSLTILPGMVYYPERCIFKSNFTQAFWGFQIHAVHKVLICKSG